MASRNRQRGATCDDREVLYGFHPVMEALVAGRRTIHQLLVDRTDLSGRQSQLVEIAAKKTDHTQDR